MAYTMKKELAHQSNFGIARSYSDIRYIVIHYTANDGDHDEGNAKYFQNPGLSASAHYFVDDDSVTQSVLDNYTAFSVGGAKWSDCPYTGGGKMYGIVTNANSISIEMCDTVRDGNYQATEKTMENAATLCRELMKKYNIDIDHVVRHFDVNGKHCPVYFMDETAWQEFKNRLRDYTFATNKSYVTTQACYLRTIAGDGNSKVKYANLSDKLKKKCRKKGIYAVFKKGKRFRLMKVRYVGNDVWGKMKSGYYVPLVYSGKKRIKQS